MPRLCGTIRTAAKCSWSRRNFLDRYVVFTASGSTGVPALLVQDRRAVALMTYLSNVRALGALTAGLLAHVPGQAAVIADGGHFLSTTMFERRLRMAPFRRRIARFYSVLDPLPKLVDVPAQLSRDVRECLRH
jgi:phenylacetate-CoA ligase